MYVDSLVIEGLGDTKERGQTLLCRPPRNYSTPAIVTIEPLTPAVVQTQESLKVTESFGGFFLDFNNAARSALSFYIYKWVDEHNEYEIHDVYSSQQGRRPP